MSCLMLAYFECKLNHFFTTPIIDSYSSQRVRDC